MRRAFIPGSNSVVRAGRRALAIRDCYRAFTGDHRALQPLGPKLFLEAGRMGRPALKEEDHAPT
jgi:hypothetical protein